ncbi:MAG: hypothetical protein JO273_10665 [Methylobacteriaceae bacterium]|nr:hypothetical protein [Methylobacteriaceae bacterium]
MRRIALSLAALAAMLAFALPGTVAQAQNARSWVASFGSDVNPCNRAQPCATFAFAITKTNAGGEINCVDQGEFGNGGQMTITKSITIDCEGVQGRVLVSAFVSAFEILAGPGDVVVLRGLDINGARSGEDGILFASAAALHIEKCVIHDFVPQGDVAGWGIEVGGGSANAEIFVSDSTIVDNGTGNTGGGIIVHASGLPGGIRKVVLNRVEVRNNVFGIKADGADVSGVINMTVRDSVSAGNAINGIVGTGTASGAAIVMMIDRSATSHNLAGFGVIADGPKTTIRLGGSSIAGNPNGVGVSNGGVLQSYGTNQINGNSNDGIALLTPIGLH